MASPPSPPARPRRPASGTQPEVRAAAPVPAPDSPAALSKFRRWQVDVREFLSGDLGKSYGGSLLVHLVLLGLLLAVPVYSSLSERSEGLTTIIAGEPADEVQFDGPVTTEILADPLPVEPLEERSDQLFSAVVMENSPTDIVSTDLTGGLGGAGGEGEGAGAGHGTGTGGMGVGGIRIAEPGNAIRKGNFSVWCWPILPGKDDKGQIRHGRPGTPPQVFQDYHIVIRLRVPGDRKAINLSDFSGEVVGTDKYFQKIPEDAYFFNTRGEMMAARTGRPIPVIEGTAELLVRVPGAASPAVRDAIRVKSKLLNEEQKIELVFQAER